MSTPSPAADTRRSRPAGELWRITYPLVVTNFAQITVTLVDTALLGRYSTAALAAVALAAPVYLVAVMIVRGWATATQIVVARRLGAGADSAVADVAGAGLVAAVLTGTAVGGLLFLLAPHILLLLGGDPALAGHGADYLRVLAAAVPLAAVSFLLQGAYAGVGETRVAMLMMLLVNIVNLLLGLLFIYGMNLGVAGAGLAGTCSMAVGAAFMTCYGRRRFGAGLTCWSPAVLRRYRPVLPALWRLAWPESALLFVGYVDEVVLVAFVAQLGGAALGAHRLLDNITLVIFTILAAGSTALTIALGQRLGAGRPDEAETYRRAGLALSAAMVVVPVLPVLLVPEWVYGLLTPDRGVVGQAAGATLVAVVSLVPLAFALNLAAALRAAGDNRTVLMATLIGDYAVLVPLAWLLGVHLGWGLPGIYTAWIGFGIVVLALVYRKYRTGRWRTDVV